MTLLSEASFLVTPNGYKEDKLYAAIPTNGNGDMTVTRATTATRVNEAGLVELVPYNIFLRSEQLNNGSWGAFLSTTITPNTSTAPDGALTADRLQGTASNWYFAQSIVLTSGVSYTISMYVKSNTGLSQTFRLFGCNIIVSSDFTATNEWQRFSFTFTSTTLNVHGMTRDSSNNTVDLLVWGAQLNEGSSALTYQKTVDRLDIPRIDYTGGGCPSILLEPQRTNIVLRSQEFDNAAWLAGNVTATASSGVSPDGTNNAYLINVSVPSAHSLKQTITVTASTAYVFSFWAKRGTITNLTYSIYDNSAGANILLTNYYSQTNSSTWTRINIPFTTPVGCTNIGVYPIRDTPATGTFYLYGAQVEAGAYPTSYIPTTTATVTRNADVLSRDNIYTNNLITAAGGTWFIELDNNISLTRSGEANISQSLGISDNSSSGIVLRNSGTTRQEIFKYVSASPIHLYTTTTDISKIAIKWNGITADVFVNGAPVVSATSFTTTLMQFFQGAIIDTPKYIKQMALFPKPLIDAECQALTTL